jgi:Amt family ammonium transporter
MELENVIWTTTCGFLVFFMQAGFAMLEVGTVRAKNAQNILMKNVIDLCIAALSWWLLGYGLAFGEDAGLFVGTTEFANPTNKVQWMFQFAFSATSATIVSGALAERTELVAYISYTSFMTAIIYPFFVHWVWGKGWLHDLGFYDFAGTTAVHMTGGVAALVGAVLLGARKGRFENPDEFKPHNVPLVILGMMILWLGWYGFNAGSITNLAEDYMHIGNICLNISLSGAAAGLTSLCVDMLKKRANNMRFDVASLTNGILAGMVSITGCPPNLLGHCAFVIGIVAGIVVNNSSHAMKRLRIDDPLDAFAVHGVCGLWGTLAVGIFSPDSGLVYGYGFKQLGYQLVGAVTNIFWVGITTFLIFYALKRRGWLRIDEDIEVVGIDRCEHGGKAYHVEDITGTMMEERSSSEDVVTAL